eukprot:6105426-Amphidinium_carterae.1
MPGLVRQWLAQWVLLPDSICAPIVWRNGPTKDHTWMYVDLLDFDHVSVPLCSECRNGVHDSTAAQRAEVAIEQISQ